MRTVAPRIAGFPEITVAEDQHEYLSLTATPIEYADGSRAVLTRWRLSPEEVEAIGRGSDIYVELLGAQMQPIRITVGAPEHLIAESRP